MKRLLVLLTVLLLAASCRQRTTLFKVVSSKHSGIHFNNKIEETDSLNPIDVPNIYNGGGVGIGDFNNDGLQDIYFTGNKVSNKLYLNKGDLEFEDITESAGVSGNGKWCRGVSVVDINNDRLPDMYVSVSIDNDPERRKNLLYINLGKDSKGYPSFKESAAAYGLDDTTHSTMASFFDYDNDGDLDMYLVVNQILRSVNPSDFKPKVSDGSFPSTGRLYRNVWDSTAGHPFFTNVTREAGLTMEGYGHAVTVADINRDGWKDIFVSNDFIANDLLYINNKNGTFTDRSASCFKHTSANGMGQDIIDINNDGLSDIVELDMNPEDNFRKKMMMNPGNYRLFQLNDFFKYQYQYVRNTLQINQGPAFMKEDSSGDPIFSDVAYAAGIAETDWSWTPLIADFDNNSQRDIIISNGFPKDITDHDFLAYRKESAPSVSQEYTLAQIPQVKLPNYAYNNLGNCRFADVTEQWGLSQPSFSNGAAYADLDNDGDLEIIFNNINDEASLYENTTAKEDGAGTNYLRLHLSGDSLNTAGIGSWVELYYDHRMQAYECTPYRGYLSSMQADPQFGLDTLRTIDSVIVKWPDGKRQVLRDVAANQVVTVRKAEARETYNWKNGKIPAPYFEDLTDSLGVRYSHVQTDYIDFNIQGMLPHKFSEAGPALAAGDINGDGLDDLVAGGNTRMPMTALLQQANGSFTTKTLNVLNEQPEIYPQDMGVVLFDADNDGDLDLYVGRGGYESRPNTIAYQDQFFRNDGRGNYSLDSAAIPANTTSKSCVRAIDYDNDGDLDLFVGGRILPWNYPKQVSSSLYRNDTRNGAIRFVDVTKDIGPELINIGLISDAIFSDFNNDGWPDLVLAGDWMPITFFKNDHGKFSNVTANSGISAQTGWWNSVVPGDFDNDGDIDYVVGNLGQNSYFRADSTKPVKCYSKDFDRNGSYDAFMSLYLPASQADTARKEFPAHLRDDAMRQMVSLRKKFPNYNSFALATMNELFSKEQLEEALIQQATTFNSVYCRNDGKGKFTLTPLPDQAQLSALNGMVAEDLNGDGNLDLVMTTNDYSSDVSIGRYDALNGLLLVGDGKGSFTPKSIVESGIFLPGNGKALVKFRNAANEMMLAAVQNRGNMKVYKLKAQPKNIAVRADETNALVVFKDGRKQKQECPYGSSLLSQSARFITVSPLAAKVVVYGKDGKGREVEYGGGRRTKDRGR